MKTSGIATLDVSVDEKGRVTDARVMNSSGNDKYDRDALGNAKKWKFKPSMYDGKARPAHVAVEIQSRVNN